MKLKFLAIILAVAFIVSACGSDCPYGNYPYTNCPGYTQPQYPYYPNGNTGSYYPGGVNTGYVPYPRQQYPYYQPNGYTYPCNPGNPYCY